MSTKAIKIIYWTLTILFVLAMLADAFGGITQQEAGKVVLQHLGYPMYLLVITGVFKLFGAMAILQNRLMAIKEWAFAGFFINFVGAIASRYAMYDPFSELIPPLVMMAIMFILYYFWKQYNRTKIA
ncbi:DoxX family protein [Mucilaginibacter sp. 21P]|uniref:DoxX family protein n=1 Tax=Mucilaginibacter sp. 21P TaxID=2778902 RepID=UPI001C573703|nr:DoxX family protein [Mucilaginibacter sp. 21P]QXV66271.1 DoxX family protein [Mucilaginibacter sp. 21P]